MEDSTRQDSPLGAAHNPTASYYSQRRFYRTIPSNSSLPHGTSSEDVFGATPSHNVMLGSPHHGGGILSRSHANSHGPATSGVSLHFDTYHNHHAQHHHEHHHHVACHHSNDPLHQQLTHSPNFPQSIASSVAPSPDAGAAGSVAASGNSGNGDSNSNGGNTALRVAIGSMEDMTSPQNLRPLCAGDDASSTTAANPCANNNNNNGQQGAVAAGAVTCSSCFDVVSTANSPSHASGQTTYSQMFAQNNSLFPSYLAANSIVADGISPHDLLPTITTTTAAADPLNGTTTNMNNTAGGAGGDEFHTNSNSHSMMMLTAASHSASTSTPRPVAGDNAVVTAAEGSEVGRTVSNTATKSTLLPPSSSVATTRGRGGVGVVDASLIHLGIAKAHSPKDFYYHHASMYQQQQQLAQQQQRRQKAGGGTELMGGSSTSSAFNKKGTHNSTSASMNGSATTDANVEGPSATDGNANDSPADGSTRNDRDYSTDTALQDENHPQPQEGAAPPPLTDMIKLGICCMRKKLNSSTMDAMLERFEGFGNFQIVRFEEEMILNEHPSRWPTVDVMIAFFSSGFPLEKAVAYADLHPHIFFITEPRNQRVLLDRRDVYDALRLNNVPHPKVLYCNRDGYRGLPDSTFEEHDDYIIIDGQRIDKPFVEKPVSAEDHKVQVYYKGGGMRKLFRKVGNKSSDYCPDTSSVRRDGSYIYEEFIETEGKRDIKCYTVGPGYVFAETRKAPTGDGLVLRREDGKEMREPITLRGDELMAARKVIKVFRQIVCGFDILRRADGKFFVCDVNGWSFVKNVPEYVDHATAIMRDIFVEEVRKRGLHREFRNKTMTRNLLGVVGVMRHADRTPKQKVKIVVNVEPLLLAVFDGERKVKEEIVFKSGHPKLDAIHDVVCALLSSAPASSYSDDTDDEANGGQNRREVRGTITPVTSSTHHHFANCSHNRTMSSGATFGGGTAGAATHPNQGALQQHNTATVGNSKMTPLSAPLFATNAFPSPPVPFVADVPSSSLLQHQSQQMSFASPSQETSVPIPCMESPPTLMTQVANTVTDTSMIMSVGGSVGPSIAGAGLGGGAGFGVGYDGGISPPTAAHNFSHDSFSGEATLRQLNAAPATIVTTDSAAPPTTAAADSTAASPDSNTLLRSTLSDQQHASAPTGPLGTVLSAPSSVGTDPTATTATTAIGGFQSIASVVGQNLITPPNAPGVNFSVRTGDNISKSVLSSLVLMKDVLARQHEGLKVQVKPREWDEEGNCIEALLVCKWGGWLTDAGHKQAQMMGRHFLRRIFGVNELTGIQKSQYVAQTNNERRVIHTAVEFSSAMLGEVFDEKRCTVNENLLGKTLGAKTHMAEYSDKIKVIFNAKVENPSEAEDIKRYLRLPGMSNIVNSPVVPDDKRTPRGALQTMRSLIDALCRSFAHSSTSQVKLYRDESMALLRQRWTNLLNALYQKKNDTFDTTKIPDIFDNISYDVCYNQRAFKNQLDMYPLFTLAEALSTFISDGEFGITPQEKRASATLFATPLLEKISEDLRSIANRHGPSMRMYFTSESHVTGLKNLLYNSNEPFLRMEEPMELHFLSHFVFKLYRYPDADPERQYQIEVHFSMGMDKNMFGIVQEHHVDYASVTPMIRIHNNLDLEKLHWVATQFASEANTASSTPGGTPSVEVAELTPNPNHHLPTPNPGTPCSKDKKKDKAGKKKKKDSDDDD